MGAMIASLPPIDFEMPQLGSRAVTTGRAYFGFLHSDAPTARLTPELERLRTLERRSANWDGRGSAAPNLCAVSVARQWLQPLFHATRKAGLPWHSPHITSSEDGEVTFEWWRESRKITVYFSENHAQVLKVWGADIHEEMEEASLQSTDEFRQLWDWLHCKA